MNAIEKLLRKLRSKERDAMLLLMYQLKLDYKAVPGIQALVGKKNHYRVRIGNYRIIFTATDNGETEIIRVTKRNEKTYKDL